MAFNGIEEIHEELALKLKKLGVNTLLDMVALPESLLKELKLNRKDVSRIMEKKGMNLFDLSKGSEVFFRAKNSKTIPLGSKSLNELLNGGVRTGLVTDFFGASNTGKTQICFHLCVNAQFLENEGAVVYLDSSGVFRPDRIREISQHMNIEDDLFKKIMVFKARDMIEQMEVTSKLKNAPFNVRLLIIDTLTDNFMFEYQGEERIIKRQNSLARHLHDLCSLAVRENIAIVVTNTVRTKIGDEKNYCEVEAGGNVVSQGVHVRVHLFKEAHGWRAELVQPPMIKPHAHFMIDSGGIVDNGEYGKSQDKGMY
jgi:RecA/RadA recombinase